MEISSWRNPPPGSKRNTLPGGGWSGLVASVAALLMAFVPVSARAASLFIGRNTQPVSQSGSFAVTPGTGTFVVQSPAGQAIPIVSTGIVTVGGSVSVSNFPATQAVSQSGAWTVTPGTGAWNASGSTVSVSGSSVTAFQGGAPWNVSGSTVSINQPLAVTQQGAWTVTPGTGTWAATQSGQWNVGLNTSSGPVKQDGSWTVTAGTGTWNVTGSSVVAYQGDAWTMQPNYDTAPAPGSIGALGAAFAVTGLHGVGSAFVSITGTWVGTINIQSSVDGVVWSTNSTSVPGQSAFSMAGITSTGTYRIPVVGGFNRQQAVFTAYTSGSATVQFYYSSVVADPFVFQSIAANLNATVFQGDQIAVGVRASTGVTVQELKDTGRQVIISSAAAITGVTTEALFTLVTSTAFTTGTSGTSFSVPVGKTLRLQNFNCVGRTTGATAVGSECRLRVMSSGTCTVNSPIVADLGSTIPSGGLSANSAAADHISFFDGFELSGTQTFCISHLESTTSSTVDAVLMGYQY